MSLSTVNFRYGKVSILTVLKGKMFTFSTLFHVFLLLHIDMW